MHMIDIFRPRVYALEKSQRVQNFKLILLIL